MSCKVEQFNGLAIKSDYLAFFGFRKNCNVVLAAIKRCIACTAAYQRNWGRRKRSKEFLYA